MRPGRSKGMVLSIGYLASRFNGAVIRHGPILVCWWTAGGGDGTGKVSFGGFLWQEDQQNQNKISGLDSTLCYTNVVDKG